MHTDKMEKSLPGEEREAEQQKQAAGAMALADEGVESAKKEYLDAPFSYDMAASETVILNSGALQHTVTDFSLPGRNGFGLTITRRYDSISANEQDINPTNSLRTETRNNDHYNKTYGLGYGWSFVLPSIEIVPEADRKAGVTYSSYLHLEDGRRMEIAGGGFKDYTLLDVTIEKKTGAVRHPVTEASRDYHYAVSYRDGGQDFFAERKDKDNKLDSYKLVGRQDRFGGTILFDLEDGGGMTVTDTWGREVKLEKEDTVLSWTLPDGGVIRYETDKTCLRSVTDQAGRVTGYDYLPWTTRSGFASEAKGGNSVEMKFWLLSQVAHPTGAVTKYTYGLDVMGAPMELEISNYDGRRRSLPLRSRYDSYGGLVYNRVTYSYEMSLNKQHVQYAHVENEDQVKETHTFNEDHLRTSLQIWHAGKVVTRQAFSYGEEDHDKKLLVKEEHWTYNPQGRALQKDMLYTYSADKKGDVTKAECRYPTAEQYNQTVETTYGDYGIVTEKISQRDGEWWLVERSALLEPDRKVVESSELWDRVLDPYNYDEAGNRKPIETRRAKSQFVYDDQYRLIETRAFHGEDLEEWRSEFFGYDDEAFVPDPAWTEARGVTDTDGAYADSPHGEGIIRSATAYDACGRPVSTTDPAGNTTTVEYDLLGRATKQVYPDGSCTTTEYDDRRNRITGTDANGNRRRTDYTPLGQVGAAWLLDPDTLLATKRYDAMQRPVEEAAYGGDGRVKLATRYTYDRFGRVLTATAKGAGVDSLVRHEYAELVDGLYFLDRKTAEGEADAPDLTTETYVDVLGHAVKTIAGDAVVTSTYDLMGNLLTRTGPRGNVSRWEYDWAGRAVKATNALGHSTTACYDTLGNKVAETDAAGNELRYTYDQIGRLVRRDAPFDGADRSQVRYYYSATGQLIREKVQVGLPGEPVRWRESEYRYDSRGRRTDVILYENQERTAWTASRIVYDPAGNKLETHTGLTQDQSDLPHICRYTYDRLGNVLTAVDPRSCGLETGDPLYREERCEYDPTGLLLSKTDRNGSRTVFEYNGLNQVVFKTVAAETPGGTVVTEKRTVYARNGQMLADTVTESAGGSRSQMTIRYRYDHMGRLVRQEDPADVVKTFVYDEAGNRTGFLLCRGGAAELSLSYSYDELNRLAAVHREGQDLPLAEYTYDIRGNRSMLAYPAGDITTSYAYNDAGLLTLLENRRGGQVASSWQYAYRLDGNQVSKTDRDGVTITYSYDDMGRLVKESDPQWNTVDYTYDRFGNRSAMAVSGAEEYETSYEYHPNNWLLREEKRESGGAVEATVYQYDGNGNQCYREWERTEAGCNHQARIQFPEKSRKEAVLDLREYNGFGQLIRVYRDGVRTKYRYRPDGLRHSKTTGESTTYHHWDGAGIVMETCGNGLVKARYLRGGGLLAQQIDGSLFHYLLDGHGNVVQRIGPDGNAAPMYRYDAFGNQKDPADTDPNPFRYCGEYHDAETGEIYLRNRSYAARTGRFTSEDPARDGMNWYMYCAGNPVAYADPMGLAARETRSMATRIAERMRGMERYNSSNRETRSMATRIAERMRNGGTMSVGYVNQQVYGDVRGAASGRLPRLESMQRLMNSGRGMSDDARESMQKAQNSLRSYHYVQFINNIEITDAVRVNYDPWAIDILSQYQYNWKGEHVTPAFLIKVYAISQQLGINHDDLMAVMAAESRFDPAKVNEWGSGATGLIQFMPSTAILFGTTAGDLAKMSAVDQLDYVHLYLESAQSSYGKLNDIGDIYMAVFAPHKQSIGKPDTHPLYLKNDEDGYAGNSNMDFNSDGVITRGEAIQHLYNQVDEYWQNWAIL